MSKVVRKLLLLIFGKPKIKEKVVSIATLTDIDLVELAYKKIGVLNYENFAVSGEQYLLDSVLPIVIPEHRGVIFDVGANVGDVSLRIARSFPRATIWAFEPNPVTYDLLKANVAATLPSVHAVNLGLGAAQGQSTLHCYEDDQSSGHASAYKDVFGLYENYGIEAAKKLKAFNFGITTIDVVCSEGGIAEIDFVKIDVEGNELNVLRGATNILSRGGIRAVQFEFADCNVISRVFLRDFYEMLPEFKFFRLHPNGLVDLGTYAARHEIFQFQNILAVTFDVEQMLKASGKIRFLENR